jgi:hypothetical protein
VVLSNSSKTVASAANRNQKCIFHLMGYLRDTISTQTYYQILGVLS